MITFAIAEDNTNERHLVKRQVEAHSNYSVVILAENGYDLLTQLNQYKTLPDILLIDVNMPKIDGLLLTSYITSVYPSISIIALSNHCNKLMVSALLAEGARGFIFKSFLYREPVLYSSKSPHTDIFRKIVLTVLGGYIYIDKAIATHPSMVPPLPSSQQISAGFGNLKKESFKYLLLNAAELTYEEIARLMCLSLASIKKHYNQLSLQFNVSSRKELTTFCIKNGLVKLPLYFDVNPAQRHAYELT